MSAAGASAALPSAASTAAAASKDSRLPQTAPLSKYKVVFLGDQGTGKTSIIKAFMYGSFDHNYQVRQDACRWMHDNSLFVHATQLSAS